MQILAACLVVMSCLALLTAAGRPSSIRSHSGRPSPTTHSPSSSPTIIPSKRPTTYSEFLFYDVFTRVSSKKLHKSTSTTQRTNTRRPTTRPTNTHKPSAKHELAEQQVSVCTHSVDNYHVIISPTGIQPSVAEVVCESFGWQYAIPPQEDWLKVHWVLANCTYYSTGQHAYAGHYTGGCQFVQQGGASLMKLGDDECDDAGDFPILCMDTPVVYTATTTTTILFETTEYVKNAINTKAPKHIDRESLAKNRVKQLGEIINGYDVCTSSVNGYHLVYDPFTSGDAETVCSDLGWYLAEIPYTNSADILDLFDQCQPYDIVFNINSYDNLIPGLCHFAYILPWPSVWMILSNNPVQCSWFEVGVLCQEDPTSVTVSTGTMVLTTASEILTSQVSQATNTVTITL